MLLQTHECKSLMNTSTSISIYLYTKNKKNKKLKRQNNKLEHNTCSGELQQKNN